eukprot:749480-Hanusia_phi.AAC.1
MEERPANKVFSDCSLLMNICSLNCEKAELPSSVLPSSYSQQDKDNQVCFPQDSCKHVKKDGQTQTHTQTLSLPPPPLSLSPSLPLSLSHLPLCVIDFSFLIVRGEVRTEAFNRLPFALLLLEEAREVIWEKLHWADEMQQRGEEDGDRGKELKR